MKKTDNYFVISNYNADPRHLLAYCNNYTIYDQSTSPEFKEMLSGLNVVNSRHTGHNITDYFQYFIDNYDALPGFIALIKGNIFPRHLSKEFFERVYHNKRYTFLFEKQEYREKYSKDWFLFSENEYLEYNNSWFIQQHPHIYSSSYNWLLKFIYKDPVLPRYNLYSPGACYILSKHNILKNTRQFYRNLIKLISYTNPVNPFPSEAHQIEWMSHIIYSSNYEINPYMDSDDGFDKALLNSKFKISKCIIAEVPIASNPVAESPRTKLHMCLSKINTEDVLNILEFGVHSWDSLDAWTKAFPNAHVHGVGVVKLPQRSSGAVTYMETPVRACDSRSLFNGTKIDVIAYEGYYFKEEAIYILNEYAWRMKTNGVIFLGDVQYRTAYWMKVISRLPAVIDGCFSISHFQLNDPSSGTLDYIVLEKHSYSFFYRFYLPIYNYLAIFRFLLGNYSLSSLVSLIRCRIGLFGNH